MKTWIPLLMLGFGVTLAIIVGQRMSTDAMSVVIGVAVGVAASVPTSVMLVALMRRERRYHYGEQSPGQMPPYAQMPQPPVIVVNPNGIVQGANQQYMPLPPPEQQIDAGLRRLRVVGGDDDWHNDW